MKDLVVAYIWRTNDKVGATPTFFEALFGIIDGFIDKNNRSDNYTEDNYTRDNTSFSSIAHVGTWAGSKEYGAGEYDECKYLFHGISLFWTTPFIVTGAIIIVVIAILYSHNEGNA